MHVGVAVDNRRQSVGIHLVVRLQVLRQVVRSTELLVAVLAVERPYVRMHRPDVSFEMLRPLELLGAVGTGKWLSVVVVIGHGRHLGYRSRCRRAGRRLCSGHIFVVVFNVVSRLRVHHRASAPASGLNAAVHRSRHHLDGVAATVVGRLDDAGGVDHDFGRSKVAVVGVFEGVVEPVQDGVEALVVHVKVKRLRRAD